MEFDSDRGISVRLRDIEQPNCCRPNFRSKWITNRAAILILVWNFLGFSVYHYFTLKKRRDAVDKMAHFNSADIIGMGLVLPIGGWLADAYFGRYRVIRCGMWIMWVGAMLNGLSFMIGMVSESYGRIGDPWVAFVSKVIMGAGLGAFQANIIQFGIDQLEDASSAEITTFIMWYLIVTFLSGNVAFYSSYCNDEYVAVVLVAVWLTLGLCLDSKENLISEPLSQILKIVYFTIKSKRRRQTAVCLKQPGILSKFDVSKRVYNGPFTNDQVEDVKTFFRVMVVIITFMIFGSGISSVNAFMQDLQQHFQPWPASDGNQLNLVGCYRMLSVQYFPFSFTLVVVPLYQLLVQPWLGRYLPTVNITTKFCLSIVLLIITVLSLLGIESAVYVQQLSEEPTASKCIFQQQQYYQSNVGIYWMLIPYALIGMSLYLFMFSGIQFICAQAPFNMKGLIIGLSFALYGSMSVVQSVLSIPFIGSSKYIASWQKVPLTCGMWYLIMEGTIVLAGFILVIVMVKMYKRRERTNSMLSQSYLQDSCS